MKQLWKQNEIMIEKLDFIITKNTNEIASRIIRDSEINTTLQIIIEKFGQLAVSTNSSVVELDEKEFPMKISEDIHSMEKRLEEDAKYKSALVS